MGAAQAVAQIKKTPSRKVAQDLAAVPDQAVTVIKVQMKRVVQIKAAVPQPQNQAPPQNQRKRRNKMISLCIHRAPSKVR